MAIAHRTGAAYNASLGSMEMTHPASVQVGDIAIGILNADSAPNSVPAAWTLVGTASTGGSGVVSLYWRKFTTAPANETWGWATYAYARLGVTYYSGVDNTTPLDVTPSSGTGTTSATAAAITTVTDGCLLVAGYGHKFGSGNDDNTITTAGWTRVFHSNDVSVTFPVAVGNKAQTTKGNTGSVTGTTTDNAGYAAAIWLLALRPGATTPTIHQITASGTSTTTGSAATQRTLRASAAGASATTGTAAPRRLLRATGTGTSTTVGTAAARRLHRATATGASVTVGTAAARRLFPITATGARASTGTAAATITGGKITGTANSVTVGTAAVRLHRRMTGAGASTSAGTVAARRLHRATATGTSATAGTSTARLVRRITATGTATSFGAAAAADTQAPAKTSIVVDRDTVVITYNEPLDPAWTPYASQYYVEAAGTPATVNTVTVSGDSVTLTISPIAEYGEPVTVAYAGAT